MNIKRLARNWKKIKICVCKVHMIIRQVNSSMISSIKLNDDRIDNIFEKKFNVYSIFETYFLFLFAFYINMLMLVFE